MDFENFEIALVLLGQFQKIRKYTRPPKNLISIVLITCGNVIVNPLQQKKMFLKNYETVKLRLLNFETVCVYVFIFFHREGFFRLQDVQDILEGTDQRSCVVNIS